MSTAHVVDLTRTQPVLHDTSRGNLVFVQPWKETTSQINQDDRDLNGNGMDIESVFALLHQADSDVATLTRERDDLLEQLDILCNTGERSNDCMISTAARREIQELIEENETLQEQIRGLRKWQDDFESQLSQGHYEAEYSVKELLDIHQYMEQNIKELQTYISQGISTNTGLHTSVVQNYVTEVWNSFNNQQPHWKMIVTENIQLKKHINDLEEALQMKHADVESEACSDGDSVNNVNKSKQETLNQHEKDMEEHFAQLLFEATEKADHLEKDKTELEKVISKWKEFGDYLKNENKELENQLHQALDDIQRLEEKIDGLEDDNPSITKAEKDKNEELEKQLRKALEDIQNLEYKMTQQKEDDERSEINTQREIRTESASNLLLTIDSEEEKLRTGRVVEELASHLTELVLQVEREKTGSKSQCSDECSDESLDREEVLLKEVEECQKYNVELQIQLEEIQQELNSQKLRNMVLGTQIVSKKVLPRGAVPIKRTEDASTNTEHFGRSSALYAGGRSGEDHRRASFIETQKQPLETSL